ncbi:MULTISPECIES: hypothetical protein [Cyanophyceae]|nr:hypothetical protein [Trichocoleus sp. FACHB-40]
MTSINIPSSPVSGSKEQSPARPTNRAMAGLIWGLPVAVELCR